MLHTAHVVVQCVMCDAIRLRVVVRIVVALLALYNLSISRLRFIAMRFALLQLMSMVSLIHYVRQQIWISHRSRYCRTRHTSFC